MANVDDPIRYKGNTNVISGCGEVKVNMQEPATVTATENTSR